ncbi:MAG: OB-fold nucleic acid binding domain-containing protein, partial [Nocardioides sp.]
LGDFGTTVAVPDIDEWDKATLLGHERDMLGLYVSDHPLLGLEHVLAQHADCTIGQLIGDEDRPDGDVVNVCGLITGIQRKITRKGDAWAVITVEDLEGAVEVLLFPSAYQLAATLLTEDTVVAVKGRLSRSKDQPELHGLEITVPDVATAAAGSSGPVVLTLASTRCTPPLVAALRDVLSTHPGTTEVHLQMLHRTERTLMRLDDRLRVSPSQALFADLKALLGPQCLAG